MCYRKLILGTVSSLMFAGALQAEQSPQFPEIPLSMLETSETTQPSPQKNSNDGISIQKILKDVKDKSKKQQASKDKLVTLRSQSKALDITVEPGINQVIPISLGHINRIVTPYDTPSVNTISDATIEANENVLYVATDSEAPVTMFIKPDVNDESAAISLTLSPKKIPPIEVTLSLQNNLSAKRQYRSKKAEKWEKHQPYVDSIVSTMKSLALKKIPEGYSLGPSTPGTPTPSCIQNGLVFQFNGGQFLQGHNLDVAIGTIQNISQSSEIEFDESNCFDERIVAVSSWPNTYLLPGQKTEVYVMVRNDFLIQSDKPERPSLLGGLK